MKKKKLFLCAALVAAGLFAAAIVYAVVRYFVLASSDGFDREAFLRALFETLPALVVLAGLSVGWILCYRLCADKPMKKMIVWVRDLSSRVESGEDAPEPEAAGTPGQLAHALAQEETKLNTVYKNAVLDAEKRSEKNTRLSAARALAATLSPRLSFGGLTYGVCAEVFPCASSGADFTEAFMLDRRRLFLAIGDVWGRGLPAALFAERAKQGLVREIAAGASPGAALTALNAALASDNDDLFAVTLFAGVFNTDTGELRFANAGHLPPVVMGEEAGFLPVQTGAPLGLFEDLTVADEVCALRPGEGLFLYTDGLTDCRSGEERFGFERLLTALRAAHASALSADAVVAKMTESFKAFSAHPEDDAAMLAVYFPTGVQKLLRPELSELEKMHELLDDWLAEDPRKKNICLACEEIFTNIVQHAGARSIQIACEKEDGKLVIRLTDDGEPFNPLQATEEPKDLYGYAEGGMGLNIIRSIAGEIFYRTKLDLNVLTVRFPIIRGV